MSQTEKNNLAGREITKRKSIHDSGVSMPPSLFARLDRIVKPASLRSRGELLVLSVTIVLDMCEDHSKRYLPEVILQYDANRPAHVDVPKFVAGEGVMRAGTHFSRALEERIAVIARRIGWSRNQVVMEAVKTIVRWCEEPSTRRVPLVALLYDTAVGPAPKLKRKPG